MSNLLTERRFVSAELRATNVAGKRFIRGYAARYNSPTDAVVSKSLGFQERCGKGCFARAIRERQDVRLLQNHDPNLLMSRTANGSLLLRDDDQGLWFEGSIPDTTAGSDLYAMIQSGLINQCSFSFIPKADRWGKDERTGMVTRELVDLDLLDVSAVTFPCYTTTSVEADERFRSLCFPNGVPAEVQSRMKQQPYLSDEQWTMQARIRLALLD